MLRKICFLSFFVVSLLPTDASPELVLSDPDSEVYYLYLLAAGGGVELANGVSLEGEIHPGPGDLDSPTLPDPIDLETLRSRADRIFDSNTTLVDPTIDDVVFVDGIVHIRGSLRGTGTLVASRDIRWDTTGQDAGAGDAPTLDPSTRLSLIAGEDIRVGKDRALRAVVRAGRDISFEKGLHFEGAVVADGILRVKKDSTLRFLDFDDTPPAILPLVPTAGGFVASSFPTLTLGFDDDLSGVRLETLVLRVDGIDRSLEVVHEDGLVRYTPLDPLADGPHTVEASILDHSDNPGEASWVFTIDTVPPALRLTSPEAVIFNDPSPTLRAVFDDDRSGIELGSWQLEIEGADHSAACILAGGEALCQGITLGEGLFTARATIRDRAGNTAADARAFELRSDHEAPTIVLLGPADDELPEDQSFLLEIGYDDDGIGIDLGSFELAVDGTPSPIPCATLPSGASCQQGPLAAGPHTFTVTLADFLGNSGVAILEKTFFAVDHTPPVMSIVQPAAELIIGGLSELVVEYSDEGFGVDPSTLSAWLDGGALAAPCQAGASMATCPLPMIDRGAHVLEVEISDLAGNSTTRRFDFLLTRPVTVAITEPIDGTATDASTIDVIGTVGAGTTRVQVNGREAALAGESFTLAALPIFEGNNRITAVAFDADGDVGRTIHDVLVDRTPPRLAVDFPPADFRALRTPITVSGLVNDLAVGTIGGEQVSVWVAGNAATVENRSFAAEVDLVEGINTLVVEAEDRAGNSVLTELRITYSPPIGRESLRLISGDRQNGEVGQTLAEPLVVELLDAAGLPSSGREVVFRVARGDGRLDGGERIVVRTTDAQGQAMVGWTLGSRAGEGFDRLWINAPGVAGRLMASAVAEAGPAGQIHTMMGDRQRGAVGQELAEALEVVVFDSEDNPLAGVPVRFRVADGGGMLKALDGSVVEEVEVVTDARGMASAAWTLGGARGFDQQQVEASIEALPDRPASFRATAFVEGDPSQTRLSGLVLDNQGDPVPGYTMYIGGAAGGVASARTDAQGQFSLGNVPVGHVFLHADGSTASRPGLWTSLEFELFTVAGIDNVLDRPIFVLPLDVEHGVSVGPETDAVLTLEQLPGFELRIPAGSATFPDGSKEGVISVTAVHADKVPMAPGAGMQPRLIVTIQPAGTHFDPPAQLTLPNVDAHPPGTITEMFSFDHDLAAFVSIGTATVSEDATVVRSDPGFGIVKAGWHCAAPPEEDGDGGALEVEWKVPNEEEMLYLCVDQDPPQMKQVFAVGTPPKDAAWTFEIFNASVAELEPRGSAQCNGDDPVSECANAAICLGTVTAGEQPGITEVLAQLTCCPSGKTSNSATAKVATVRSDLRIQGLAEDGEPAPSEAFPGALIPYLDPAIPNPQGFRPAELELVIEPQGLDEGEVTLSISGPVRVWGDAARTQSIPSTKTWDLASETPPQRVYLEGTAITGFGAVQVKLDFEGCEDTAIASVYGVQFTTTDPCMDDLDTWLLPNGLDPSQTGQLTLEVVDGAGANASQILSEQRGAGAHMDAFQLTGLTQNIEFEFVQARWELAGTTSLAWSVPDAVHFMSFGQVRHTQYNTPHETHASCTGANVNICTRNNQCAWQVGQMSGTFAAQVADPGFGTGSGQSANFGLVKQEFWCQQHGDPNNHPPAACNGLMLFERNAAANVPACGGGALGNDTVAMDDFYLNGNAPCGSEICIRHNNMGVRKTVSDRCPVCGQGRIDNFSTSQECGILDYDPNAVTLRLYQ